MKVQVRFRGLDRSEALVEYATRRAHQHLSRFGRQVSDVLVRLSDLNGPRGGRDKRCQVTVSGPRIGTVSLVETHDELYAGLDVALDRLDHRVGRCVERIRNARFPAAPPTRAPGSEK